MTHKVQRIHRSLLSSMTNQGVTQRSLETLTGMPFDVSYDLLAGGEVDEHWEHVAAHAVGSTREGLIQWFNADELPSYKPVTHVTVTLFKPNGKYYSQEEWAIPQEVPRGHDGGTRSAIGPYDMEYSPDFRRISGGPVLVESQEPWGFPHLFPAEPPR